VLWSLWSNRVEILAVGPKVRLKVSRNFSLSIKKQDCQPYLVRIGGPEVGAEQ